MLTKGPMILIISLVILGSYLITVNAAKPPKEQSTLYNGTEGVLTLNYLNFHSIYNQPKAFFVQFYAHWCGYCKTFSTKYARLGKDIVSWKDVVQLAAINCGDPLNLKICRDQEGLKFPTVRFYHPYTKTGSNGKHDGDFYFQGTTVSAMRSAVIRALNRWKDNQTNEVTAPALSWPDTKPVHLFTREDLMNQLTPSDGKPILLVIESVMSHVGTEVILDLSSYMDRLTVRRMVFNFSSEENTLNLGESLPFLDLNDRVKLPILLQVYKGDPSPSPSPQLDIQLIQKADSINGPSTSRKVFVDLILKLYMGHVLLVQVTKGKLSEGVIVVEPKESHITNEVTDGTSTPDELAVHMVDLSNALRYSLYQEILLHEKLNSTQMDALQIYLQVLTRFFPFDNENPRRFVKRMSLWANMRNHTDAMSLHAIMRAGSEGFLLGLRPYITCHGSKPELRGYPCALWLLFHTLTVAEMREMRKNAEMKPTVLIAMRAYVGHFFTCKYCSKNFLEATNDLDQVVQGNINSSVLWLWRHHNDVNRKLSGRETEDPFFPKVPYPTSDSCPECLQESEWDESRVLSFIETRYDRKNLQKGSTGTNLKAGCLFLVVIVVMLVVAPDSLVM